MPRTKTITLDGASFTIAPLTLEQAETWKNDVSKSAAPTVEGQSAPDTLKTIYAPSLEFVVCPALNNVLAIGIPAEQRWTVDRCYRELDQMLIDWLFKEILTFCGYGVRENKQGKIEDQPGEAQAPSTSQQSAGA